MDLLKGHTWRNNWKIIGAVAIGGGSLIVYLICYPEANVKGCTDLFHSALLRKNMPCSSVILDLRDDKNDYFVAKLGLMLLQDLLEKLPEASVFGVKTLCKTIADKLTCRMEHESTCNKCNEMPAIVKGMCLSCYNKERTKSAAAKEGKVCKPNDSNIGKFVLFYSYVPMLT